MRFNLTNNVAFWKMDGIDITMSLVISEPFKIVANIKPVTIIQFPNMNIVSLHM